MSKISEPEFLSEFRAHIKVKYGNQKKAAEAWGVSDAFVSSVSNGRQHPSQAMLDEIGYQRFVVIEKTTEYVKTQQVAK